MTFKKWIAITGACVALAASASPSLAQQWPSRTVKVVVPYGVGGPGDTIGRLLGKQLTESLGQPVVIDNRPGAGATIGASAVAASPADGVAAGRAGRLAFGP